MYIQMASAGMSKVKKKLAVKIPARFESLTVLLCYCWCLQISQQSGLPSADVTDSQVIIILMIAVGHGLSQCSQGKYHWYECARLRVIFAA
jgi:hypothetical protein